MARLRALWRLLPTSSLLEAGDQSEDCFETRTCGLTTLALGPLGWDMGAAGWLHVELSEGERLCWQPRGPHWREAPACTRPVTFPPGREDVGEGLRFYFILNPLLPQGMLGETRGPYQEHGPPDSSRSKDELKASSHRRWGPKCLATGLCTEHKGDQHTSC